MGILKKNIVKYTRFDSGDIVRNKYNNKVGIVIKSCFLNYEDNQGNEVTDYNKIYYEVFWVNGLRKRKSSCYMCEYGNELGKICEVQCEVQCEVEDMCKVCCKYEYDENEREREKEFVEGFTEDCVDYQKRKNCRKCDGCRILREWQENCIQRTRLLGYNLGKCFHTEDKNRCCMIEYGDGIRKGAYYLVWDDEDREFGNEDGEECRGMNEKGINERRINEKGIEARIEARIEERIEERININNGLSSMKTGVKGSYGYKYRYRYVREDMLELVGLGEIGEEKG